MPRKKREKDVATARLWLLEIEYGSFERTGGFFCLGEGG
jgi:hypothetical protein